METHGRGPKDIFVRGYPRWRHGKLEWVRAAHRSNDPPPALKPSPEQMPLSL